jgi:hypothetical protein
MPEDGSLGQVYPALAQIGAQLVEIAALKAEERRNKNSLSPSAERVMTRLDAAGEAANRKTTSLG